MGFFSLLSWKLTDLTPVSGNGGTFWQMIFELNVNVCMRSWMYTLYSHGLETTEPSLDSFGGLANEPLAMYYDADGGIHLQKLTLNMPILRFLPITPHILQCALRLINCIV
jgi:hypothetical protein